MKPVTEVKLTFLIIGIVFLVVVLFLYYDTIKNRLLMDEFCEKYGDGKMLEYRIQPFIFSYAFKCEGRGDMVFSDNFKDCTTDEWGDYKCVNDKPKKSVWKNFWR